MDYQELFEETTEEDKKKTLGQRNKSDVGGFLVFAVVVYIYYSVILISAQDILASTSIPTVAVILCTNSPFFAMTLFLPYFIDNFSLMNKAVATSVFLGFDLLFIALIETPAYRLFGVAVASIGIGTAEIGFLSATSLHEDITVHSFACGTGIGGILGTAYISVITTVVCVQPTTAILLLLILVPVLPFSAWLIKQRDASRHDTATARGGTVEFKRIGDESPDKHHKLTLKEKLAAAKNNLYLAVPLFIELFSDYLIMNSIITTLAFESSPFDPRNHFQYYHLTFWISEWVGRSYGLVILLWRPTWRAVTNKTWILATILVGNMIFLLLISWYRFVQSVGIVLFLVVFTGITEGALYLNTFAVAGINESPRYKEFSRAFLTVALEGGIVVAGLTGWIIEPLLREHCRSIVSRDDLCLTRLSHGQWNATSSCVV